MIKNNRIDKLVVIVIAIFSITLFSSVKIVRAEKQITSPYGPVKPLDFNLYKEYYASRSFIEYEGSEFGAGVVTDLVFSLTEENIRSKRGEDSIKGKFNHFCGPCHGVKGDGEGKFKAAGVSPVPANFTNTGYMVTLSDSNISAVIKGGSASVGKSNLCPPWGLTFNDDIIGRMTSFVRGFSVIETADAAGVNKSEVTTDGLKEEGVNVLRWILLGVATVFFIAIAVLEWGWLLRKK